jgi:hypothetical protein
MSVRRCDDPAARAWTKLPQEPPTHREGRPRSSAVPPVRSDPSAAPPRNLARSEPLPAARAGRATR